MAGELDDAFDALPEAQVPAPLDAQFDALPQVDAPQADQPASAAAPQTGALEQFRAKTGLTYPYAAAERQASADRQAENELIRRAAREAFDTSEEDDVATARAVAVLGVPFSQVRQALPAWRKAAALEEFDPEKLDPALRDLLLKRPDATGVTLKTNEAGHIVKAIRAATDFVEDAWQAGLEAEDETIAEGGVLGTATSASRFLRGKWADVNDATQSVLGAKPDERAGFINPLSEKQVADRKSERVKRDTPKQSLAVDNPEAQAIRESGRMAQMAEQYRQAKAGLELSRKQTKLMRVENGLEEGDAASLRAEIADAKNKLPLLMESDPLAADFDAVAQGAASSVDVMGEAVKTAGVVGLGTGALAGLVTLATTRNPTAARSAAIVGARLGADVGAKAGAFLASAELETGSSYDELRDLRTNDGRHLTPGEAMGGAVVLGLLKATVEVATLGKQTELLRKSLPGGLTGLKSALATDPTLRALVARVGKDYAKSVASEGGEELVQDALEQLGNYVAASAKDKKLQSGAVYDVERGAHALEGGLFGGLGLGGATSIGTLALRGAQLKARASDSTVAPKQAAAVLALAQHNLAQVAPAEAVDLLKQLSTEAGGAEVTALHVPATAVLRFFQDNGANPDEAQEYLDNIVGDGAYRRANDLARTGARIELPIGLVMERWGRSAIGKALAADTSTTATGETLREAAERGRTFDGPGFRDAVDAVQRLAQDEEDVTGIDSQLAALEQQLVDTKRTTRSEARQTIALLQHFIQTQAQDSGVHPADLLARFKLEFHQGSEKTMEQMAAESSGEAPTTRIEQARPPALPRRKSPPAAPRTGLNADEEASIAGDAAWMEQFGLNRSESIERARLAVKRFRPALTAQEKLATTKKDMKAAQKAAAARLAERQKASLALLDFIERKGAGIVVKGSALEKRRAEAGALVVSPEVEAQVKDLLRQRFEVLDPLTGRQEYEEAAYRGTSLNSTAKMRKKGKGAVSDEQRSEFMRNVHGRTSQTRTVYQTDTEARDAVDSELLAKMKALSTDEVARTFWLDPRTGLLNKRGFDTLATAGRPRAIISVEGTKFINDGVSYEQGDELYKAAARALASVPALNNGTLAKYLADFAVLDLSQEELDAALREADKYPGLNGFTFTGTVDNNDTAEALVANNQKKIALEKSGARALRGARPFGAPAGDITFKGPKVDGAVPADLAGHIEARSPEERVQTVYREASGLLTKEGMDAYLETHQPKFEVELDVNLINVLNDKDLLGWAGVDDFLNQFGELAVKLGAHEFTGAHISGDEYKFFGDDEAALKEFVDELRREAQNYEFEMTTPAGTQRLPGATFGAGVGRRGETHEFDGKQVSAAIIGLHADKHRLGELGERSTSRDVARQIARSKLDEGQRRSAARAQPGGGEGSGGGGGARTTHDDSHGAQGPESRDQELARDEGRAGSRGAAALERGAGNSPLGEVKRLGASDSSGVPFGYAELPAVGRAAAQGFKIFLNKKATASTPVHELAHVWMAMLRELVAAGAGQRTAQTLELARKALGVADGNLTDALTVEQEERFARAFEVYLREGKAPKPELESVFARFRAWLLDLYRTLSGRMREDLNDELRTVFDRLLATDEELARWKEAHGPDLFGSAEEAGMSDEQWREYQADLREAEAKAANQALASVLRERLAETQATIDEETREWQREYSEAWERLPLREAWTWLEEGFDAGDGEKHRIALDRAAVRALVGEAGVRRLPTVDDGTGTLPDELAQGFGYDSGGRFLAELLSFPQKETWVGREVAARQVAEIPGAVEERQRLRAALDKAMAPQREKQILEGWQAMRSRAPAGVPSSPPLEEINRRAKAIVDSTQLRSVIPARALASERSAANEAARAGVVGDAVAAMEAMQRQLLSAAVHREQLRAVEERDSFLTFAAQLARDSMRREAGKARPTYRDAIDYIVSALQLPDADRVRPEALERGLQAIDAAARAMEDDGQTLGEWASYEAGEVPGARLRAILGEAGEWRGLRVADMRVVREALEQLRAAVRSRNEVLLGDSKAARETVKAGILGELRANARVKTPATKSAQTTVENLAQWGNAAVGFLTNPSDAVRKLTADNRESVLWQATVEPMRIAKHKEADLLKSMVKPVVDAFEKLPRAARSRLTENIDGASLFAGHTDAFGVPRKRFELLVMALNMGNDGNKQRLLDGRRISEPQVLKALEQLSEPELDWVQSVWDSLESMREAVFALEESDSGLRPEAVRATPLKVRLADGTVKELRGGYFPAVYEKAASSVGERQAAESVASLFDKSYTRAGTPHSHTKARADQVSAVISLEPNTVYRHFAQVAHDLAFRPVVKSVGSLLLDPDIELELKQRIGEGRAGEFKQWVKDVGSMRGVAPDVALDAISTALRRNLAPAALGYSLPTALSDVANPLAAVAGTDLKLKFLAAGTREYLKAPIASRAAALEKSGELRFMQETLIRDFARQVKSLTASQRLAMRAGRAVRDNAFVFMEAVQVATATPVWLGAYEQGRAEARAKGLTSDDAIESHAVRFADDVLVQTWPNHSPVDASRLLRDRGYWGMTAVFFGYLNVAFRAQVRLVEKKKFGALLGFWIAYSVLGEVAAGRGPDEGDEDDEEPDNKALKWRNWFMRKLLAGPFGSVPAAADAYAGAEAIVGGHKPNPRLTPVAGAIDSLMRNAPKALDGDAEASDRAEAAYRALAPFVGGPTRPLGQAKYLRDWLSGELDEQSPLDVISGAVYGQRDGQPLNAFSGIEDARGE